MSKIYVRLIGGPHHGQLERVEEGASEVHIANLAPGIVEHSAAEQDETAKEHRYLVRKWQTNFGKVIWFALHHALTDEQARARIDKLVGEQGGQFVQES